MKVILVYIWRAWFVVLGFVMTLSVGSFIYLFALNERTSQWSYKLIRIWCLGMFYGMGFRYELIKETRREIEKTSSILSSPIILL